jgi:zinc protease
VLDEIAQIDESWRPETITYLLANLFPQSPYGRPPAGSARVVKSATPAQVAEFYRSLVTGPNTVVGIFGDVDVAAAEALVRRLFADLPDTARPLPKAAPQRADEPVLFIRPKPPTRTAAGIGIGFVGMQMTDTDDVAATAVLDTIISGYRYPTGWIYNELRGGDRSLVYEVHAINVPGLIPGYFGIYAACQPAQVGEVYAIISEQLERARRGGFTPEEMEQARSIIATTELMQTQTNQDRAMQACLDELYGLGHDYRAKFRAAVGRVTAEDAARMARKYFTAPTVVVVTPEPDQVRLGIQNVRVDAPEATGQ